MVYDVFLRTPGVGGRLISMRATSSLLLLEKCGRRVLVDFLGRVELGRGEDAEVAGDFIRAG
jgi:hypothetical protein